MLLLGVAHVLAWSARHRTLAGQHERGSRSAEEALAIAERFGLVDLQVHALTTIGSAKEFLSDVSGREDLERAVEIGRAANSAMVTGALNNLSVMLDTTDSRRVQELQFEALREAERFGDEYQMRFMRGNLIPIHWLLGEWDEAVAAADEFIAECEEGLAPRSRSGGPSVPWVHPAGTWATRRGHAGLRPRARVRSEAQRATRSSRRLHVTRGPSCRSVAAQRLARCSKRRYRFWQSIPTRDPGRCPSWRSISVRRRPSGRSWPVCRQVRATEQWSQYSMETSLRPASCTPRPESCSSRRRRACVRPSSSLPPVDLPRGSFELERALAFYRPIGATLFVERGERLLAKSA